MKRLRSKEDVVLALELWQITQRIRKDTRRQSELKTHFKKKLEAAPEDPSVRVGDVLLLLDTRTRENVDRTALRAELGERAERFISAKPYVTLSVRYVKGDEEGEDQ